METENYNETLSRFCDDDRNLGSILYAPRNALRGLRWHRQPGCSDVGFELGLPLSQRWGEAKQGVALGFLVDKYIKPTHPLTFYYSFPAGQLSSNWPSRI